MAGSSAGSIFVDLLLRDANYVAGINRARNSTKQFTSNATRDLSNASNAFRDVLNPIDNISASLRSLAGIAAGALSVQELVRYSDTWKQLQGRLLIVEGSIDAVGQSQIALSDIAARTRSSLEGVTNFYSRLKQFIPEAERAQYDLLGVTESVATALTITGETTASSIAAMIQFTQAIGTNFEAAGQELRSLQEQAPRLTQALMSALGDGTKSLQQLKEEGLLTRQSVLNALSGMGEEGRKLAEELAKVPVTVGQAFTQLDNAFLEYIGKSELVNAGTSSLSAVIQSLANNIDLAAKALLALSLILIGRVVVSFGAAQLQALNYQLTLARMAKVSATAAVSTLTLGSALRVLNASLAFLGGPIGVAIIAVIAAFTLHTNQATEAQGRYNEEILKTSQNFAGYAEKSEEAKKQILEDNKQRILALIDEQEQLEKVALGWSKLRDGSIIDQVVFGGAEILGKLGIGTAPTEAMDQYDAVTKSIEELYKRRRDAIEGRGVSSTTNTKGEKPDKAIEKWLIRQREALETLRQEADYIGKTTIEIEKLKDARQFEAQVAERSYGLKGKDLERFREQAEAIKNARQEIIQYNYELSRSAEAGMDEFFKKYSEDATNAADNVKSVLTNAFKGAEDAFIEFTKTGKLNFRDFANSIIEDLLRIQFRKSVAGILDIFNGKESGGTSGSSGSGGGLFDGVGKFFSSIFDGFHADGGYIQPGHFGVAGEAGAELLYGGKTGVSVFNQDQVRGGGNTYQFNVGTQVNQDDILRLQQMVLAAAGPGVIEQRVSNARSRGAL